MADEDLTERFARYSVSPRLFEGFRQDPPRRHGVGTVTAAEIVSHLRAIVELNADYPGGVEAAKAAAMRLLDGIGIEAWQLTSDRSRYNIFASLSREQLTRVGAMIEAEASSPIFKIWPDEQLKPLLNRSVRTIKADACFTAYGADGQGIVWAVADSGIDGTHVHFSTHATLALPVGLEHKDFSSASPGPGSPLVDGYGHGTHVAGIIAGETRVPSMDGANPVNPLMRLAAQRGVDDTVRTSSAPMTIDLRGVASKAKLMSLKVLDGAGNGYASNLIAALEHLEGVNDYGRRIRVHGVNLSLGYPFDASWFAAGHSPLCAVVNRIARSGVVVVAAAGNDGASFVQTEGRNGTQRVGLDQSINDPGNAEEAITVGATHADAPHKYGVSYFSSKGPTADGRAKPDLVAPGERILSCAASGSSLLADALDAADTELTEEGTFYYREQSGTSMAAPHVSGAAAALLSVRSEFIGRSEEVKRILVTTCTDLKRKSDYQGAGLLDLMRAIQSV